jgi:phosphopantetheinyl transferase
MKKAGPHGWFLNATDRTSSRVAFLRGVLASYLDADPASLSFAYNNNGRPKLVDARCAVADFNSRTLNALLAIS